MRTVAENVKLAATTMRLRFHTTHLLGFVVAAAVVFAVIRHPETLRGAFVAMIAGVFIVLPVLATVEALTPRSAIRPQVGWRGVFVAMLVCFAGIAAALVVGALLLN